MRTSEERIHELHQRMDARQQQKNRRRYNLQSAAVVVAALVVMIMMAIVIASAKVQMPDAGTAGIAASIFAERAAFGYIVVALLAFCLGAFVTIFCFRLRKHKEEKNDDRKL